MTHIKHEAIAPAALRRIAAQKLAILCMAAIAGAFLAACGPSKQATKAESSASSANAAAASAAATPGGVKHYQLTGRVVSVDKPNKSIVVDGDEIPGFMSAMQMPYDVKDAKLLDKIAAGDQIKADIVSENENAYLQNIVVTGKGPAPKPGK
ncbi:MAG: copper-binding protein [Acidobacteriales bacterium]|nr:copper-binding protein [Terriglobales bacterium]